MSWGEEQKKEIETIRERKITVKLSDADCDRLARKCGEHGLTIGELIENFVGDLVGGTYSNGSDERDYADQWFEMSKEIRELEENSKRIIENMRPQTIAQYHIKQWLDDNFIMGCARLEYTGKDTAKVMDTVGGVMYVEYKNGEVRECQK
jgi:hypothetical protein